MNIKPTYVTFEQAKLLKQIKFLLGCRYGYTKEGILETPHYGSEYLNNDYENSVLYEAPEQWQIVEWASLVHNIDIEARPVRYAGDIKTSYYQPYINGCIVNISKFATRQEALSEAINEFLKII